MARSSQLVAMKHRTWFAVCALLGAGFDFLSKELVFHHMADGERVAIVPGVFEYYRTMNPGIVFGGFPGASTLWLVVSIVAVPTIVAIFWSVRNPRWVLTVSLGLILGGTIGNGYDRITEGAVRDFIGLYYAADKVWPYFNLADSNICVGVALLSLEMLFFDDRKQKKDAAPAAADPAKPHDPNAEGQTPQSPPAGPA